uniref:Movement protein n=1 Tax=Melandrium yellow fleck virus TaxID=545259 RepID=A0A7D5ZY35_9BROM|nr:3a protein [Melandrium yellow fleck virus]
MSNLVKPFTGRSSTVTEQVGSSNNDNLISELFSEKAIKEMASECKLGMYTNLSSDKMFNYVDLVPKTQMSKLISWTKSEYEQGKIPSSGVLSVPRILLFIVRTVSSSVSGSITVRLCDSGVVATSGGFDSIDNQEFTVQLSALPALVALSPSYDCPMEVLGGSKGRNRCFGLYTQLNGVVGVSGTVAMTHAYWNASFKVKPNNYKCYSPKHVSVAAFDRLQAYGKKELKQYIKNISNQNVDYGLLLGSNSNFSNDNVVASVEELDESSVNDSKPKIAMSAKSIAGVPASAHKTRR